MESGLTLLAWFSAAVLLAVAAWLAVSYNRLRSRLDDEERKRSGIERIIDQANDGIFVLDFVSGAIYHANPSAAAMIGMPVADLQRRTVFDLHFP